MTATSFGCSAVTKAPRTATCLAGDGCLRVGTSCSKLRKPLLLLRQMQARPWTLSPRTSGWCLFVRPRVDTRARTCIGTSAVVQFCLAVGSCFSEVAVSNERVGQHTIKYHLRQSKQKVANTPMREKSKTGMRKIIYAISHFAFWTISKRKSVLHELNKTDRLKAHRTARAGGATRPPKSP